MKERITFVHGSEDPFDPMQFDIRNDTLHIKSLKAAREDRLTVGLYELPYEVSRALKQIYELHVRWTNPMQGAAIAPFVSTASPGLHIFFTPLKDRTANLLGPLLLKVSGGQVNCTLLQYVSTSILTISERFASSAALQYHKQIPFATDFGIYIREKICSESDVKCKAKAATLASAQYVDVDYDTITQALSLSGFWISPPTGQVWDEQIDRHGGSMKVEVGILASEKSTQPEELSLGGFLVTLGEDSKPNPTLFSFPSRHHLSASASGLTYSASFTKPTGLHPNLRLTFPSHMEPPAAACALHTYLTLPSFVFPDKYQLSSPNFLASKNLRSIRSLSGETDLEAPDWAVTKWGSALLLELATPSPLKGLNKNTAHPRTSWHADIPLHLRYLPPSAGGINPHQVPWPIVFWACPSDEGTKMNTNPFDRVNLGYDGLFGPRTMFYHLRPGGAPGEPLQEQLSPPVLDLGQTGWVESGTVGVVLLGFLWVCWRLGIIVARDLGWARGRGRVKKE